MKSLIIFGGSFDPIHNGHLAIAEAASECLNSDVVFVPAKAPRWKETHSTPTQRVEMLQKALNEVGNKHFSIDLYELNSNCEVNYSIDTIRYFKDKYKDTYLYLLIGADQVNQFDKWKDAKELSTLAKIIFVNRPNNELNDSLVKEFNMKPLDYDKLHIVSSSDVREAKNNEIPLSVRKYIEDNSLYYINKVRAYLTDKRFSHSLEVARLAYDIAKENSLENANKAYIAGLLHDIGKYVSDSESQKIMNQFYPEYISLNKEIYHQFIGEYLVKKDFLIEDEEILEAIKWHTTGKIGAGPIAKIVYCSDKIEPTRGFDSSCLIEACKKNYLKGFQVTLISNFEYFQKHNVILDDLISKPFYTFYCGEDIWKK